MTYILQSKYNDSNTLTLLLSSYEFYNYSLISFIIFEKIGISSCFLTYLLFRYAFRTIIHRLFDNENIILSSFADTHFVW
jgi:hypothetical protein